MKRTLLTLMFLATFGMALAGPPVDYRLVCGTGEDAPLVGVASLVEDQLHVALIDGALEECGDGVYGVADGVAEPVFTVSYTFEGDMVTDVQVAFDTEDEYLPELTYKELPAVAVEGKLGAQRNREAARERVAEAHARAEERAGGKHMDVPGDGGDSEEEEAEADGGEGGGPPADLPAPANSGRR